jgi:hypothetical protein
VIGSRFTQILSGSCWQIVSGVAWLYWIVAPDLIVLSATEN